jgi:outer membrane protein assembly factor BamB
MRVTSRAPTSPVLPAIALRAAVRAALLGFAASLPGFLLPGPAARAAEAVWPQFRGPGGRGLAAGAGALPAEIGPDTNVVWKTALPPGHSSPVIGGDRIYLTAADGEKLLTLALERASGKVLWKAEAEHEELEEIHTIGSHAQSSPATDGERMVSFFGSSGLLCYAPDGRLLWRRAMGPFKNNFGAASSPVIAGDLVLLNQDHDTDSFLMALEKRTGKTVWKTDRSEFPRGFSTPAIWEAGGRKQVVVTGTLRAVGYDLESGKEVWTVRGLCRIANVTPIVGSDGILYLAGWSPGADPGERIEAEPWTEQLAALDKDRSGTLERTEVPEGDLERRFNQIDRDKSGSITRAEYEDMARVFHTAQNAVLAVKPGGEGDITDTHVLWRRTRLVPYVPSPLLHDGLLFTVKDGGIVSAIDARTGEATKEGRVSGGASYYSSPVLGDGKLYLLSQRGELSVVSARAEWEEIASARFGEEAYATPAIVDGRIYLRTAGHLYCFASPAGEEPRTRTGSR